MSGSVVEKPPTVEPEGWFSAIDCGARAMSVGASFTFVTVIVNCFWNVFTPSLLWTRIEYELFVSKSNDAAVFSSLPEIVKEPLSPSPAPEASEYVNERRCRGRSSRTCRPSSPKAGSRPPSSSRARCRSAPRWRW